MVLTSRTREREERKKKKDDGRRKREEGEETRERARKSWRATGVYECNENREDSHTDSSLASLSFFREAFRHACKFLKPDTFPRGTFEG